MKKLIIFGFFIFCILPSVNSQTVVDSILYRFTYDAQIKVLEEDEVLGSDEHVLEIGKTGITKYYSRWKSRRKEIIDSIHSSGGSSDDILFEIQKQGLEPSYFNYEIVKNYPNRGKQTINYSSIQMLQYSEPMGMEWTFEEGDSIILGHSCCKAKTDYHNRRWEVWYALDIPISDGPWKLCGLPGLILKAIDLRSEFIFNCISIEHITKESIVIQSSQVVRTEAAKAHKIIERAEEDPIGYMNMAGKKVKMTIIDKNGRVVTASKDKPVFIESYD